MQKQKFTVWAQFAHDGKVDEVTYKNISALTAEDAKLIVFGILSEDYKNEVFELISVEVIV